MNRAGVSEYEAGVDDIKESPADVGRLELVVARPAVDERWLLDVGRLDPAAGLVGDTWAQRRTRRPDGTPDPDRQLTLMNARAAALFAGERDRWALAGDQLYVDFDLSETSIPVGTRLAIGTAVIEITAAPHTGCVKFARRYGRDAQAFVNTPVGRELRLRGVNARVIMAGDVRPGDDVRRVVD
jgi:MOSC domain-containing protein YiiM